MCDSANLTPVCTTVRTRAGELKIQPNDADTSLSVGINVRRRAWRGQGQPEQQEHEENAEGSHGRCSVENILMVIVTTTASPSCTSSIRRRAGKHRPRVAEPTTRQQHEKDDITPVVHLGIATDDDDQRRASAELLFQATIAKGSGDEVRGKHLVLVQDVPTKSATLAQCTGIPR